MNLASYLKSHGFIEFEGYSQQVPAQVKDLIILTRKSGISIMEIGFNAGHSAEIFLKNNPSASLVSFDIGDHDYVHVAKQYIDNTYPGRHTLILGDSTITVPQYIATNANKFDVIFIDGGHEYNIAVSDLENCKHLAHLGTIVILDDTIFRPDWKAAYTVGPTTAWNERIANTRIIELGRREYQIGRGMAWGRYNLNSAA